ncbi:MAG: DsbA family protein [Acidimicrobiia bacterium]
MHHTFSITYDYLCPFARNANETVVEMLREGASYDVAFVPFSLKENHGEEGDVPQWDLPIDRVGSGVLALLWSIAVRDNHSDVFPAFHVALFSARHDDGADINDPEALRSVAASVGLDSSAVRALVETGVPGKTLAAEHTRAVEEHGVFGVPTFVQGDEAVFVRIMNRHQPADVQRVLDMLSWTNLNEFKRTSIER